MTNATNGISGKMLAQAAGANLVLGAAMAVGYIGVVVIYNVVTKKVTEKKMKEIAESELKKEGNN